ncbi:heat stress transcription factor B-2a-like [Impatiens glandulifera]|uniref:heat stress transcription factor B-2a-like n=1 Tax=Impatiens glandulifera TaxID=253017 RepID=UPI001FB0A36E|nr:heat stress transcription factor B-2a-like [Impatiens glandulifera]
MSLPPGEANGGEVTCSEGPRSIPTPFLTKTYQLVDDKSIDEVISWNEDGSSFIVWNQTEFAKDLLPKYFKHNNFSSFVRQLNTYGFRKLVPDRWEFFNDCFRKGEKGLLSDIQRRKIVAQPQPLRTGSPSISGEEQVISSYSPTPLNSGSTAILIDENKRLRRENLYLNKELSELKSLCNNIYALMSSYMCSRPESGSPATKPALDLMPLRKRDIDGDGGEKSPKLFGVPIGVKRSRDSEDEKMEQMDLRLVGGEVKLEPLDHRNGCGDLRRRNVWLKKYDLTNERNCNRLDG